MEIVLMENWFFLEEDKSLALFTLSKQDSKGSFRDLLLDYCLLQVLTKNSHWVQVASRFVLLQRESTTTTCIRNFNSGFLAPPDTFMGTIYSVLRGQEISNSQPPTQVTSSVNNYSGIALVWLLLKLVVKAFFISIFITSSLTMKLCPDTRTSDACQCRWQTYRSSGPLKTLLTVFQHKHFRWTQIQLGR